MASSQSQPHTWVLLLLLCATGALLLWHHVLMEPSCGAAALRSASSPSLSVVVVADLHLAGPRTAWVDRVRRESFMRSVFQVVVLALLVCTIGNVCGLCEDFEVILCELRSWTLRIDRRASILHMKNEHSCVLVKFNQILQGSKHQHYWISRVFT